MSTPTDSPVPERGELRWLDMNTCALLVHITYDGVSDIHAGQGISPAQAAVWLRELANHFEAKSGAE